MSENSVGGRWDTGGFEWGADGTITHDGKIVRFASELSTLKLEHQRQNGPMCGVHCVNNVIQIEAYSYQAFFQIAKELGRVQETAFPNFKAMPMSTPLGSGSMRWSRP